MNSTRYYLLSTPYVPESGIMPISQMDNWAHQH